MEIKEKDCSTNVLHRNNSINEYVSYSKYTCKLFFITNAWCFLLAILIVSSLSASAQNLLVSNITTPSAANGTYVKQSGDKYGFPFWLHTSGNYMVYKHQYADGDQHYYWNIDNDYDDVNVYFYSEADTENSPAGLTYTASDGTSTLGIIISEVATEAEIDVRGNGVSISDGESTYSFSNYTKFGSANVSGETLTRSFTIHNTGAVNLTLDGSSPYVSISGTNSADFSITTLPATTIAAAGSTTFVVTFNPSAEGSRTAILSIANSDSDEDPYTFAIHGTGYTPKNIVVSGVTSPSAANGTYVHQGTTDRFEYWKHSTEGYYIHNEVRSGNQYWNLDIETDGSDDDYLFRKSSDEASPIGLTGWSINSPTTGTLAITAANPEPDINVQGNFVSIYDEDNTPAFGDYTNFGSLNVSSGSRARTFKIHNLGSTTLTLSGSSPYVTISGAGAAAFSVTTPPSSSINAYDSTSFVVTFDPSAEGTSIAVLNIASNDSDEATYNFAIQGWGYSPLDLLVSNITSPSAANGIYEHQGIFSELEYWKHKDENYYIYNDWYNGQRYWCIDNDKDEASVYFDSDDHEEDASPTHVSSWTAGTGSAGFPIIEFAGPEINFKGNSVSIGDGDSSPSLADSTSFGLTDVSGGTIVRTFTIENTGSQALSLTGSSPYVAISGTDAGDFSISTIPSNSVATSSSTIFRVTFNPSAAGTRYATLSIANNDNDENPYNFNIEGEAYAAPTATTNAASSIVQQSATLNGTVNANNDSTAVTFEYGLTTSYGTSVVANPDTVTGTSGTSVSKPISGLIPSTTYHYRVKGVNAGGTTVGTDETFTTLDCTDPTAAGTIGNAQEGCMGFDPTTISSVSLPTGYSGTLEYKWQQSTTSSSTGFSDIASTNSTTYDPPSLTDTTWYRRLARVDCKSDWSGAVSSNVIQITVFPTFVVGSISDNDTICYNSTPTNLVGVAPTGGDTPYTYQWLNSTDGINFTDISGATTLNYQAGALTDTTFYRLEQTSASGCGIDTTNAVKITVYPEFVVGSISSSQNICYNSAPLELKGVAPTGGVGPYTYQWQSSTDNSNFSDISGATSIDYQPPALTDTTYYQLKQSSASGCGMLTTNKVTINVYEPFSIGSISADQSVCYSAVADELIGIAPTGGSGAYVYQWQNSTDKSTFCDITGANSINYQPPALTDTTYYRLLQGDDFGCGLDTTNIVTIIDDFAAPSVQAHSIIVTDTGAAQLEIEWTNGNGSKRAVFIKEGTSGTASPVNYTTYTANTHFKKGTQIGSSGWYCVANGTADSVIVNGLMPNSTYRVMVCEYNKDSGCEKYLTTESTGNAANQLTKNIMINEIDVDTESTDILEFIELYDGGSGNTSLDGLILIHFNGSDDQSVDFGGGTYAIDLNGYKTDANGYFVVGNSGVTGVDIIFADNNLQNGADAVALYADSASNFPNDTPVTTLYLVDAIVYDTDDADDAGLLSLLNVGQAQVNENGQGNKDNHSNQRILNGSGGLRNTSTYDQQPSTPGSRNNALPTSANGNLSVTEDVNRTLVLNDFTYVDVDGDSLFQIQLITKPTKGSLFIDSNDDGVIDAGEELANNDTILRTEVIGNKVKYRAALNEYSSPYTTFEFKVHDSLAYSGSSYIMTVNVSAVNDLPVATNDTVTTPEDIDKVFSASEFNYLDIEGSTMQQIQVTLIPETGILYNDANTNGSVDGGEELTNNDVVTKAHIDANRLKFKPGLNEFGSPYTYFNFKVHDGTAYSDSAYKMSIDVTSVNDLPSSADNSFSCPINTDYTMLLSDFPYQDVDGDALTSVLIMTVPVKGSIYNDIDNDGIVDAGENVSNGNSVSRSLLDSGRLKYKPVSGESGQPYTTFTFKVNDGTASSGATYTMTISVFPEFVVGGIAEDMIICHNSIPNPITGLAPTGGNPPYTYQWQSSSDGVSFNDIEGAIALDYQPGTLSDTTYFRQIQTSSSGCGSRITNIVTIYTLEEFIAGNLSNDQTLCYNSLPAKLEGTAPTGGNSPYIYQWQSSVDGNTFTDIVGETSLEYQPPTLTQTTYYRILQTSSSGCGIVATNIVRVKIHDEFKAGTISETQTLYYQTLPEKFIGTAPTGGMPPYTYQWQQSTDGVAFIDIDGANELDYQAVRLSKTTYFHLIQSSASGCGIDTTNKVMIIVFPEFHAGNISSDQQIAYSTVPEKLKATEPHGGRHPYTYQWQRSIDSINFTDIAGATGIDYQPPLLTQTTYYRQIQSAALGYADKATNVVTITVFDKFEVGSIAENQTVCYGTEPGLILGTAPSGGSQPYIYQWQSSVDGVNFTDIIGATELNYQPPALIQKMYFRQVQTSSNNCGSFVTNAVTVDIRQQPVVDIVMEEDVICSNTSYQLSASAQNHESVTWLSLGDGSFDDVNILNPVYTPGSVDIANGSVILAINALALSPCETMASDQMVLSFYDTPLIDAGEDLTVYENSEIQLAANVAGDGNYTYQWSPATMVTDPSILNPVTLPISQTTTLTLSVTDNITGCVFEDQVTYTVEAGVTYMITGKVESIGLKNSLPQTQLYFTGIDQSTFTNEQGEYSMQVPAGYSGWAIPSRAGYVFEPDSIAFNYVGADVVAPDFGGTLYLRAVATPDSIIAGTSVQLSVEFINGSNTITACSWQDETGEFCSEEIATVEPTQTTVYTVFVSDAYESTFDTVRVYVSTTTGIDDLLNEEGMMMLYPNPTKNIIKLEISIELDARLISIVNPNGTLVRQIELPKTANDHNIQINLENMVDGTYYLIITNSKGKKICSRKVVKI